MEQLHNTSQVEEKSQENLELSNISFDLDISIQNLYQHNWHIGSYTKYRHKHMTDFILKSHNNIDIIDVAQSKFILNKALEYLRSSVARGKKVLFVGTDNYSSRAVTEHAERCGQYYISKKWFGGLLTNWHTFDNSIKKMIDIDQKIENDELNDLTKKERLSLVRKRDKFLSFMKGIKDMGSVPNIIVIASPNEKTAIREAKALRSLPLTTIMLVDTNNNPIDASIAIPGNASSIKTVNHFCELCANACLQGLLDEELRERNSAAANKNDEQTKPAT